MSLPSIKFLHLTVSEIQPGKTISRLLPAHPSGHHGCKQYPDTKGVKIELKIIPLSTAYIKTDGKNDFEIREAYHLLCTIFCNSKKNCQNN